MTAKVILEPGRKFERWRVISGPVSIQNRSHYQCVCECGAKRQVIVSALLNGTSRSCGCLAAEARLATRRLHGESKGCRLYRIWQAMIGRCHRPKHSAYARYGARGIRVCQEWRRSYLIFRRWATENGYRDVLTIDRRDNSRGYSPSNCRWADDITQANNKSNSRPLTAWGETKTVAEWTRDARCRVDAGCLHLRLNRGWAAERALSELPDSRPTRLVVAFGEGKSIAAWARDGRAAVTRRVIERRLNRGVSPELAITLPLH
jgi:hypothetical protein